MSNSIPPVLPQKGWSLNDWGYPIYTSRRVNINPPWIKRGMKRHHAVILALAAEVGGEDGRMKVLGMLRAGYTVHHQNFDRTCSCPHNLVLMPQIMNQRSNLRCPYTGRLMGRDEWEKVYGR